MPALHVSHVACRRLLPCYRLHLALPPAAVRAWGHRFGIARALSVGRLGRSVLQGLHQIDFIVRSTAEEPRYRMREENVFCLLKRYDLALSKVAPQPVACFLMRPSNSTPAIPSGKPGWFRVWGIEARRPLPRSTTTTERRKRAR